VAEVFAPEHLARYQDVIARPGVETAMKLLAYLGEISRAKLHTTFGEVYCLCLEGWAEGSSYFDHRIEGDSVRSWGTAIGMGRHDFLRARTSARLSTR
jgi:hypothetical protein